MFVGRMKVSSPVLSSDVGGNGGKAGKDRAWAKWWLISGGTKSCLVAED